MRMLKRFTSLVGIVISAGLLLGLSAVPAGAATQRHFVLISTKGAPIWWADAQLYGESGNRLYSWQVSSKSGGRELWFFNWGGENGWIDVKVQGLVQVARRETTTKGHLRLDRDYCFRVTADGHPRYTGDSVTGGCNFS